MVITDVASVSVPWSRDHSRCPRPDNSVSVAESCLSSTGRLLCLVGQHLSLQGLMHITDGNNYNIPQIGNEVIVV